MDPWKLIEANKRNNEVAKSSAKLRRKSIAKAKARLKWNLGRGTLKEIVVRTCPFNDCEASINSTIFACRKHWFSLSKSDQQRIHWAYRQYTDGEMTMAELVQHQQDVLGSRGKA